MTTTETEPCPVAGCPGRVFAPAPSVLTCTGPEPHSREDILRAVDADSQFLESEIEATDDDLMSRVTPLQWRRDAIERAGSPRESEFKPPPQSMLEQPPSFPTGLTGLGDVRGLVCFSGKASSGKTAAALPAALLSAVAGWRVLYIAAEGAAVVHTRGSTWLRAHSHDQWPEGFALRYVDGVVTRDSLIHTVQDHATTNRTLIVIDSINSLVDGLDSSDNDVHGIGHLKWLAMWMMRVRQFTRGEVAFLVLSEANANGETKGRALDHKADVSVNFEKAGDDYRTKRVFITKNWWGVPGPVGDFEYDPERACLFRPIEYETAAREQARGDDDPFQGGGGLYQ